MTSRGLVALALGLAWHTGAAGQELVSDKKGPNNIYGILLGQVGELLRSTQVMGKLQSAKTPQDRYYAICSCPEMASGGAAYLFFGAAQLFGYEPTELTRLPKVALPFLVEALKDKSTWEAALTEQDDGWSSPFPDSFARVLDETGPDARAAVVAVASPLLTKALKDRDADVRLRAARFLIVLDKTNTKVALPVLVRALDSRDRNPRDRYPRDRSFLRFDQQLRRLFRDLGPDADGVIKILITALKDEHPGLRITVAQLLIDADEKYAEVVLPVLRAVLKGEDPNSRLNALYVLRDLGPAAKGAIPELIGFLTTEFGDSAMSVAAAETLAKLDKKEYSDAVLPALRAALTEYRVRKPPGRPLSPPELRAAVEDARRSRTKAEQAAIILGILGTAAEGAEPELIDLLIKPDSNSWQYIDSVKAALGKIGPAAEKALLDVALRSPDGIARAEAADVLKRYYPEAARKAGLRR